MSTTYISKAGSMSLRKIKEKYGLSTLAFAAIACVEASKAYLVERIGVWM